MEKKNNVSVDCLQYWSKIIIKLAFRKKFCFHKKARLITLTLIHEALGVFFF